MNPNWTKLDKKLSVSRLNEINKYQKEFVNVNLYDDINVNCSKSSLFDHDSVISLQRIQLFFLNLSSRLEHNILTAAITAHTL